MPVHVSPLITTVRDSVCTFPTYCEFAAPDKPMPGYDLYIKYAIQV